MEARARVPSRFFGISIWVYWRDHPPPHFHAEYGEHDAEVGIEDLVVLGGNLPPRALGLVIEWATRHHDELRRVWDRAANHEPLTSIEPLR